MLFDENLGFIDLDLFKNNANTMNNNKLVSTEEGFLRGNMFDSEYVPYKNYTYEKIVPTSEREKLLLEIMELCFAITDINLYLDLNPNDQEMLEKFKSLVEKSVRKEMEFVEKYGPLELIDSDNSNKFEWISNPWPWENIGGTKYV